MAVNKTTNLARALQKYYLHKGNRIIFANKMTLNQLALTMWEKLGYQGIDASVLSRVINGERLFTIKQFQAFSNILTLNSQQKQELKKTIINDILQHYKVNFEELTSFDTKFITQTPLIIHLLREGGHSDLAISLSFLLEDIFNKRLFLDKKQKTLLAKIYNEKSRAYAEICQPNQILNHMSNLDNRALELGKEANNQEILDMTYMNIGGAYYVAKDWRLSADFLEKHYNDVEKPTKLEFLRTLLLDYAYQNDFSKYKKIYSKSIKFLDSNEKLQRDNLVSLYEAMARSLSIFGFIKEARKILNEAKQLSPKPFYQSQLIRGMASTFYYEAKKGKKINKDYLLDVSKQTFHHIYNPYKRHRQQIKNILKKLKIDYVNP